MKAITTYLVWKDPSCMGINPQWVQLSREEFLALVKSPEAKGRYFERLESTEDDGIDGKFVMECTESRYKAYRKEKRHKQYLNDSNPGYQVVSYHALDCGEDYYGEEILRDESCDVEAEALDNYECEKLRTALAKLSGSERQIVDYFWLSDGQGTERGFSEIYGVPQKTVNDRKKRVLEKLKKFLK